MTDERQECEKRLRMYRHYKDVLEAYYAEVRECAAGEIAPPIMGYERTLFRSKARTVHDPTGNRAVRVAEMPKDYATYARWVDAVDAAFIAMGRDAEDMRKIVRDRYMRVPGKTFVQLAIKYNMGVTTVHGWVKRYINELMLRAARMGLLEEGKGRRY